MAAKQPDNLVWQYDLSRADNRAGILLSKMGQSARSLQMYQAGLAIREKVAAAAPDNTEYRRGLYDNYTRVGDVSARTGASQNALAAYRNALPIIEKLASSDPGNNQWQEAVASGYDKVGDMLSEAGSDDEALDNYRKRFCRPRTPCRERCRQRGVAAGNLRQLRQDRRHSDQKRQARRRCREAIRRLWLCAERRHCETR